MLKRLLVPLFISLLLVPFSSALLAQDSDTLYTRVAWWQVPRTKWQAFIELFEKAQKPVLDRMLNSGVLEEYGFDAASLHHPDGYTHSVWFSAKSLAGLVAVSSTNRFGEKRPALTPALQRMFILSPTPGAPLGIRVKSSRPISFCFSKLKEQWSVATHWIEPSISPAQSSALLPASRRGGDITHFAASKPFS